MTARNAARVLFSNDKGLSRRYCCGTFSEPIIGQSTRMPMVIAAARSDLERQMHCSSEPPAVARAIAAQVWAGVAKPTNQTNHERNLTWPCRGSPIQRSSSC